MRYSILTPMFKLVSDLGNDGLIWLLIIAGLLVFKKTRMTGLVALLSLGICFIINNELIKNLVARPRPFDLITQLKVLIARPTDFSFPSGHTASSFASAGAFYYYGDKRWGILALIFAGVIGFSRLYLGVHYPSDVICGAIIGLIISFLVSKVMLYRQEQRRLKAVVE
jgi:undecaprenyl-diphosphatase